jgi:cell division protein FtsZ
MSFEMLDDEPAPEGAVIKVVGVGGAGGNAVNHMISRGVQGVEFIAMNTDKQALIKSGAPYTIQLGEAGLGAGANPEAGRDSARARELEIRAALEGANMVFLTAGMGKGTGTGASPVVASIAKEMGILTVGVVTKPFDFEGVRKMKVAEAGIDALVEHVDSLIVVLNQKLFDVMDEDASLQDAFKQADNVLHNAVAGIAEIINVPGLVNVDFADVRTVMAEQGKAMMGIGEAAGMDRARIAAEQAVASPLLDGVDLNGARGVIVNITAAQNLKLRETNEVINTIREFCSDDATIIHGTVFDDNMGDSLRVTVVATGIGRNRTVAKTPVLVSTPVAMPRTGTYDAPSAAGLTGSGLHHQPPAQTAVPAPSTASAFSSPSVPSPAFQAAMSTPPTQAAVSAIASGSQAASAQPSGVYSANLDTPTVWRDPRAAASARVAALEESGVEKLDIPAFLRRQAD